MDRKAGALSRLASRAARPDWQRNGPRLARPRTRGPRPDLQSPISTEPAHEPRPALARTATAARPTVAVEFAFASADFERMRKLVYQHAGISLSPGKQAMVYSRLSRRLRDTGHRSFSSYLLWREQQGPQHPE